MELLLNLVWLMLALPAYWIWQRELPRVRGRGKLCDILVLGCILILLFPVISATDDLHFIGPELEESTPSKRALRQAVDKTFNALRITPAPPAVMIDVAQIDPAADICGLAFISGPAQLYSPLIQSPGQRGPPAVLFA